jgi:hypothetical protein
MSSGHEERSLDRQRLIALAHGVRFNVTWEENDDGETDEAA